MIKDNNIVDKNKLLNLIKKEFIRNYSKDEDNLKIAINYYLSLKTNNNLYLKELIDLTENNLFNINYIKTDNEYYSFGKITVQFNDLNINMEFKIYLEYYECPNTDKLIPTLHINKILMSDDIMNRNDIFEIEKEFNRWKNR